MKKTLLLAVLLLPMSLSAKPLTFLEITSDEWSFVTQGKDYYFTDADGVFSARQRYTVPHLARQTIDITYIDQMDTLPFTLFQYWNTFFDTSNLGSPIQEGFYEAELHGPISGPETMAELSISGNSPRTFF